MKLDWKPECGTHRKYIELGPGWILTVVEVDNGEVAPCIYDEETYRNGEDALADGYFVSLGVFEIMLEQRLREGWGPKDLIEWFKQSEARQP